MTTKSNRLLIMCLRLSAKEESTGISDVSHVRFYAPPFCAGWPSALLGRRSDASINLRAYAPSVMTGLGWIASPRLLNMAPENCSILGDTRRGAMFSANIYAWISRRGTDHQA